MLATTRLGLLSLAPRAPNGFQSARCSTHMAVECLACKAPADTLGYRRPPADRSRLAMLVTLLVIGAVAAVVSAAGMLGEATRVSEVAQDVESELAGDDSQFPDPRIRDGARLFASTTLLFFGAALVVLIVIPIRYVMLLWRIGVGHPKTLRRIRRLAVLQFLVGAFSVLLVLYAFGNLETLRPRPAVGVQLFAAPLVFWYSFHPWTRAYFSEFTVRRLADAAPAGGHGADAPGL
jgi:hypothetical protein